MNNPRDDGAITLLIERLKAGDESAIPPLWELCFQPLVRFAAKRMKGTPRRAADEEDVALSVIRSFCSGAMKGRFEQLRHRSDLWALLLRMTQRKAVDQWRRERRGRRGAGQVRGDSVFGKEKGPSGLDGLPGPESIPQLFTVLNELLEELDDETLRTIVILRLQGFRTTEIAGSLSTTRRTIERKLNVVREMWQLPDEGDV